MHVDPSTLSEREWAQMFSEAIWLEGWRIRQQATMLEQIFGMKKNTR